MARKMETMSDLIEEAKARALVWIICIFALAYFFSLTSNLIWFNVPIAFLIVSFIRYLSLEVEIHKRGPKIQQPSYLSHLQHRQLSPHDPLLLPARATMRWKRKIDSPLVEAAADELIRKIVQEFITDLWYSSITPDQEVPEQIYLLIHDVLGEISQRLKRVNLIDLLTRDMVDLIGTHMELYRKNQASIGRDVMRTLSSEERDERLKHCLFVAKELHPALISPENEYKVLKRLMGGVVAIVLRPQETQCPLFRCLARELLACAVMQPVMSFASPGFINEIIEFIVLSSKESENKNSNKEEIKDSSSSKLLKRDICRNMSEDSSVSGPELFVASERKALTKERNLHGGDNHGKCPISSSHESNSAHNLSTASYLHSRPADWMQALDIARQRRTQFLAPENLDNLWTKGRNYKKKDIGIPHAKSGPSVKLPLSRQDIKGMVKQKDIMQIHETVQHIDTGKSITTEGLGTTGIPKKNFQQVMGEQSFDHQPNSGGRENQNTDGRKKDLEVSYQSFPEKERISRKQEENTRNESQTLWVHDMESKRGGPLLDEWQDLDRSHFPGGEGFDLKKPHGLKQGEAEDFHNSESPSTALWMQTGKKYISKLKCWVLGAHFEKAGSKSFAVYSIAVTNSENKTWFVDRRYRNFEQLHRRLRDIPNYTLQLPPKRFLSSSLDDYFVQQRCILLDKYLRDLLAIPNIAEQHEVWDFLSATSKNYSYGKNPSVMKTLAVNVDDAMDDIVRQLKEVSDGLRRKVAGPSSSSEGMSTTLKDYHEKLLLTSEAASINDSISNSLDRSQSVSDEDGVGENIVHGELHLLPQRDGWHSDSELQNEPSKSLLQSDELQYHDMDRSTQFERKFERFGSDGCSTNDSLIGSEMIEDGVREPLEWTPPKLSVPLLNLVDTIFQLKRRGWVRRQVFWISKQILQLVMEDAIDDWLLRQIEWLSRDDVISLGIRWIQDVLWPNGVFISKINDSPQTEIATDCDNSRQSASPESTCYKISTPLSFDQQLEAARRARMVYDILLGGAPSTLVSLIGGKQYRRCARDIYFFLQVRALSTFTAFWSSTSLFCLALYIYWTVTFWIFALFLALQSSVCVKQLAYSLLELLLITMFPELQEVVVDMHGNT